MKQEVVQEAEENMKNYYPTFVADPVTEPSIEWVDDFKSRNNLIYKKSSTMEQLRTEAVTTGNIKNWFENVYNKIDLNKFDKRMIANLDESMLETKSKLTCIVKRESRHALITEDDETEHITIGTMVCTNGDSPPPLLIFPLTNLPTILDDLVFNEKIWVTGQKSGWIDKTSFKSWIEKIIIWIKNRRIALKLPPDAQFLLFLDGHNSRENSDTLKELEKNFIVCVLIPSHSSTVLQPLDILPHGYFKKYFKYWKRKIRDSEIIWKGEQPKSKISITRSRNVLAAINALHQALVYTFVERAFRLSGIYPRNMEAALLNPKVVPSESIAMRVNKRSRLPFNGGVITSSEIIKSIEDFEKQKQDEQ
jgi:hypothetical protein